MCPYIPNLFLRLKSSSSLTLQKISHFWMDTKGRGRNNFLKLALRFRSDLFDLKIQNHSNSLNYFEDFVFEDRAKMA